MYNRTNDRKIVIRALLIFNLMLLAGAVSLLSQTLPTWQPITGNEHNMIVTGQIYLNNILVGGDDFWVGTYGPGEIYSDCRSAQPVSSTGAYYMTIRGDASGQNIRFVLWNTRTLRSYITSESISFSNDDLQPTCNLHFSGDGITLHITSPTGGEVWRRGELRNITWTATNLSGYLTIELIRDEELAGTIVSSIPAAESRFSWSVGRLLNGTSISGTSLKILIRSLSNPVMATSDPDRPALSRR